MTQRRVFTRAADLLPQLKRDLPHLFEGFLARLRAGLKPQLDHALAAVAQQLQETPPEVTATTSLVPAPGRISLGVHFAVTPGGSPDGSTRSPAAADAYEDAFARFVREKLSSKAAVLRTLAKCGLE